MGKGADTVLERLTLILAVVLLCCCVAHAEEMPQMALEYDIGDYTIRVNSDDTATIINYHGNSSILTIPDEIDGYPISQIGRSAFSRNETISRITLPSHLQHIDDYAFYFCQDLEYVSFPDTLVSIGESSFNGCSRLGLLSLPASVTAIGAEAFMNCHSISRFVIPDGLSEVGANPFSNCANLATFIVSDDHPVFTVIDDVLINKAEGKLICYPSSKVDSHYEIPSSIRAIGDSAFFACEHLSTVTMPDGVISIGDCCFLYCSELTTLALPGSVQHIGREAFADCSQLHISIPENVRSIGSRAFAGCHLPEAISFSQNLSVVDYNPFLECKSLAYISVSPDNPFFASIDGVLFNKPEKKLIAYPANLVNRSYAIPQGISTIGFGAFADCTFLETITIPNSVVSIEQSAFLNCNITELSLPPSAAYFDRYAFSNCTKVTSVLIPEGVIELPSRIFYDCTNLSSVTLPASLTIIGSDAFTGCSPTLTFTVPRDSYAAQWCKDNGYSYTYPDALDWLNN